MIIARTKEQISFVSVTTFVHVCIRKTEIISYQSQYSHLKHDGQLPDPRRTPRNLLLSLVESLGARVGES